MESIAYSTSELSTETMEGLLERFCREEETQLNLMVDQAAELEREKRVVAESYSLLGFTNRRSKAKAEEYKLENDCLRSEIEVLKNRELERLILKENRKNIKLSIDKLSASVTSGSLWKACCNPVKKRVQKAKLSLEKLGASIKTSVKALKTACDKVTYHLLALHIFKYILGYVGVGL